MPSVHISGSRIDTNTKQGLHKKKQPVKHAMHAQSSLAHRLEKAEAALTAKKYNPSISTSSDTLPHDSDEAISSIPKPQGEVSRSGKNPNKRGYHLQTAMGMKAHKDLYNKIRVSCANIS